MMSWLEKISPTKIQKRMLLNLIFSVSFVVSLTYLSKLFEFEFGNYWIFIAFFAIFGAGIVSSISDELMDNGDVKYRKQSSERDIFEKRVLYEVERRLKNFTLKDVDFTEEIRENINRKVDNKLLESIDIALKNQIEGAAKVIRVIDHMDLVTSELKDRLEGPASRAESSATWARRVAYFMAFVGLGIALWRVSELGDVSSHLLEIYNAPDDKSIWPYVMAQAAPWVGLILLVEFTALLFLRFSNRAIALQRYFTEGLAELRDRHLAMRTIIEFGTPEQIVIAAKSMIIYGTRVLDDEKDAATFAAASNMMGNFTDAVKSAAEKMGGKSAS